MSDPGLENEVRRYRERLGLSQQDLADLAGVSRQGIVGIEGGRQVPSTALSLRLARALRCGVEDLFSLSTSGGLSVRLAPMESAAAAGRMGGRVALGEVEGAWVAHRLPAEGGLPADGIVSAQVSARTAVVQPLADAAQLRRNVLVSGCAPILGLLAQRVGGRFANARATWLPSTSRRSLDLLEGGLVHVAGVHLSGADPEQDHAALIRARFSGERMLLVNLTRWREGLVVPAANPLAIRSGAALLRPGLRFARRDEGAGAHDLVHALLAREGGEKARLSGPLASGHAEVAQLVRVGAADVGVAIESVALAAGLGFVPLTEERFDLIVSAEAADSAPVARLFEALDDPAFRAEIAQLPGYDQEISGHVTTLEAA
jgi:molybdate-binding protein/DNA-binding XRE family transcriptional regulator